MIKFISTTLTIICTFVALFILVIIVNPALWVFGIRKPWRFWDNQLRKLEIN